MPRVPGVRTVLIVTIVGVVLIVSGSLVGFSSIGGKYDSESFECGSVHQDQ